MFVNTSYNTDEKSSKSSQDPAAVDKCVYKKGTIFTIHKNKVIDTIQYRVENIFKHRSFLHSLAESM